MATNRGAVCSVVGQSRRFHDIRDRSDLISTPDIRFADCDGSDGPGTDFGCTVRLTVLMLRRRERRMGGVFATLISYVV